MLLSRRHLIAAFTGLAALPGLGFAKAGAPQVLLAQVASRDIDPAPYLVSEKYDGVRALWDGQALRFRSGRRVQAPGWFTAALPAMPLDGELWLGRGRFDTLSGSVRRQEPVDAEWRRLRYMVFELPQGGGRFDERASRLVDLAGASPSSVWQAAPQRRVADAAALRLALDAVVRSGGEGLMLHRADAPCLTGRNDALMKLKPLSDTEATVIGHVAGQGKYAGVMGALWLETPQGRRFKLGSGFPDQLRRQPPAIGSTVTYAYRDVTPNGLPRFASFVRLREMD